MWVGPKDSYVHQPYNPGKPKKTCELVITHIRNDDDGCEIWLHADREDIEDLNDFGILKTNTVYPYKHILHVDARYILDHVLNWMHANWETQVVIEDK